MQRISRVLTLAALVAACREPVNTTHQDLLASLDSPGGQGSKIVFNTDRDGRDAPDEIYSMNADGTDERRLTFTDAGNNLIPDWSPNGRQIAFGSDRTGVSQIYVMNADGSELHPVTTGGGGQPAWSPNGHRIAFTSGVPGANDVFVINTDGTGLVNLTNNPANDARPDWSPDGRKIAFSSNRDGNAEIYVTNEDGSDPVRLTEAPGSDVTPEWSPNGQQIVFESGRDGNREIYVMDADGTNQTRLTFDPRIDGNPAWSPDGQLIVFQRQVVEIPGLPSPNGSELFVMNPDGSDQTQLTHRTPESFSAFPSWGQGHAAAQEQEPPEPERAEAEALAAPVVVMSGLDNPRGLAFGPEGALYVAEAGRGGAGPCLTAFGQPICYGPTGAVSRLWHGQQERIATGLPSLAGPTGVAQAGPTDIALLGRGDAFVAVGLQTDPANRALLGEAGPGFGQLVQVPASGAWRYVTDVAAFEAANNSDGRLRDDGTPFFDSNPYGLLALPGAHLVTDAGANTLLRVDANGDISLLAVFHSRGSNPPRPSFAPSQFDQFTDAVPTSVAVGPDGAYYVAELTGVPFTATRANIYRVVPGDPARLFLIEDACLTGFKAIMDIAFGAQGNLYVLQHTSAPVQQLGPGLVIRVTPDPSQGDICAQYRAGTRTTVLGGLTRPTSIAIGPDGALYVTNRGVTVGGGEVLRLEAP